MGRATRAIGFSAVVSLGDSIDVDFGDLLDFFSLDRATRAILLYVESIKDARKFMSAARAAARAKPVMVVKAGRHQQGAKAARDPYRCARGLGRRLRRGVPARRAPPRARSRRTVRRPPRRSGRLKPFPGKRLAILTNGGGIGVLAVDRLVDLGGTLAGISPATMQHLDASLPPIWSRADPVDISGDADGPRYAAAFEALLGDPENDAVLVMNVPTALASAQDAAQAVIATVERHRARLRSGESRCLRSGWAQRCRPDASSARAFPNMQRKPKPCRLHRTS